MFKQLAKWTIFVLCVFAFWLVQNSVCQTDQEMQNHIKDLRKELFLNRGYDPLARPVANYNRSTNVSISLIISSIQDLDMKTNVLESFGMIIIKWNDEHLSWKPTEYGGLDRIVVHLDEVFKPDIVIYNSVSGENALRYNSFGDVLLLSTGKVSWVPVMQMRTICMADLTEWPFDRQTCRYNFGSALHDIKAINLTGCIANKIIFASFIENSEWKVVNSSCLTKVFILTSVTFPQIRYSITLERRSTNYRYLVYCPIICALLLSLMSFHLDIRDNLKFFLGCLSLLMLLMVGLYLGFKLGISSWGTPKVVVYLGQMIILVTLSLSWFTIARIISKINFAVPSRVIALIQPVERWLVLQNEEFDSVQLIPNQSNSNSENPPLEEVSLDKLQPPKPKPRSDTLILIQVVDKLFFAIFLLLAIVLHN